MVIKYNFKKALYVALASVLLIIGAAGVILPVLPAIPFLLLASFLMTKGSKL